MAWLGQMPSGCLRFRPEHRDSLPAAVGDSPRSSPPCVKVVVGTAIRLWMSGFCGGGTQWMVLSAAVNNPSDAKLHAGPKRMLVLSVDIVCGVNGDHEVIDARRRSGRADVR